RFDISRLVHRVVIDLVPAFGQSEGTREQRPATAVDAVPYGRDSAGRVARIEGNRDVGNEPAVCTGLSGEVRDRDRRYRIDGDGDGPFRFLVTRPIDREELDRVSPFRNEERPGVIVPGTGVDSVRDPAHAAEGVAGIQRDRRIADEPPVRSDGAGNRRRCGGRGRVDGDVRGPKRL